MIRSTVSTCLCRQHRQRIVDVDQLFGELVQLEPAVGVAIDLEPGRGERFVGSVAEVEPGALERSDRRLAQARLARAPPGAARARRLPSA